MRVKILLLFVWVVLTSHSSYSQKSLSVFFKKTDRFLKEYVEKGQVDYKRVLNEPDLLNELIAMISTANMLKTSDSERKAFYINAYNVLLIKNVLDDFPVPFPLEERGFFSCSTHAIAGDTLSLNEIEDCKLIHPYKDVRILFVLSSASKGSVVVPDFALKPRKLDKQLEKVIKEVVNDYDYVRVMDRSSKILMAESFKRSQSDFNPQEIVKLMNQYRKEPLPSGYTIDFYPANRKLNSRN